MAQVSMVLLVLWPQHTPASAHNSSCRTGRMELFIFLQRGHKASCTHGCFKPHSRLYLLLYQHRKLLT
jgi:hypothetical protein